jgi:DNA polymerase-1
MSKHDIVALIDSDIVAFQAASVCQQNIDWGDGMPTQTADRSTAIVMLDNAIDRVVTQLHANRTIVCLTASDNWRKQVLSSYKSNRKDVVKPVLLGAMREHLQDNYECFIRPTLEADDVMGILSTHPTLVQGKKIIVSEDKDMQTVPGWLFNPRKDTRAHLISPDAAYRFHMYQTLMGDAVDGYRGCPRIGKQRAEKILQDSQGDYWNSVVAAYENAGLTIDDALQQARVARICQFADYDYKTKEVILWNPETNVTV